MDTEKALHGLDAGEGPGQRVGTPVPAHRGLDHRITKGSVVRGQVHRGGHLGIHPHPVAAGIDHDPGTAVVQGDETVAEARPPEQPRPEPGALVVEHGQRAQR